MRLLPLLTLGLVLACASPSLAQTEQTLQPPVFATRTGLVMVDFVVTDKAGRLIGDLKPQDFVVTEDGKQRPVVSFVAFNKGQGVAAGSAEGAAKAAPPGPEPATTLLLVDDGQLTPHNAARLLPALKKLVDTIAEQKGVLALVAPSSNIQMADEPAGNRASFWAEIDKIRGHRFDDRSPFPISDAEAILGAQGDTPIIERIAARFVYLNRGILKYEMALIQAHGRVVEVAEQARTRRGELYTVLLRSLDWLAAQPGRHSVVMVSGGYASDEEDKRQQEIVTRSLRANAPIHFLDARGLEGMSRYLGVEYRSALEYDAVEPPGSFAEEAAGSSGLAADTGGLYIRNTNDMAKGLTRLVEMNSIYYVLGYEPPDHKGPGFRKIKVAVATKGLKVVSRRGYFDEAAAPK